MTYQAFLANLAVTPRTWQVRYSATMHTQFIRQGGGDKYRCPLTAVVALLHGRSFEVFDAIEAARSLLGLPLEVAVQIQLAADDFGSTLMRRELLTACGLAAIPTQPRSVTVTEAMRVLDATTN